MNYIAAVQLIPGLVDFHLYCFNTLIFNILNIVETVQIPSPTETGDTNGRK